MVGHIKVCIILLGGFVVFNEVPEILQVVGMLTTVSGKFWVSPTSIILKSISDCVLF